MYKKILLFTSLLIGLNAVAQELTNYGTDFWTGYGFNTRMKDITSSSRSYMSIFLTAKKTTKARVSLQFPAPAFGFPAPCNCKEVTITGGSVVEVNNFPVGDLSDEYNEALLPDSRLYFTGITNRAIHIESLSSEPIAAYQYSYGTDVGGATMIFPTNTWGSTYNVSTVGGLSNAGLPNSFFFVIARENNTIVDITVRSGAGGGIIDSSNKTIFNGNATPAANILRPNNTTFSITLNKGQVYNAMGVLTKIGSLLNGVDLSGTTVKARDCDKKITVFAGNGRVALAADASCTAAASSDNLIQQMFPKTAWGTKYLTSPATSAAKYNIFRINVSDPTTKVYLNNPARTTPLTGLINGYYEYRTDQPIMIESDKPVMVTQFMPSTIPGCNEHGNLAPSESEMIIISPIQQALNDIAVFSPRKNRFASNPTNFHFINVIIKKEGVATFKFDGLSTYAGNPITNLFKPHPQDANYSYAQFANVTVGATGQTHTLQSSEGFNAIVYGVTQGESYGYNAGTAIKDLSAIITTNNPEGKVEGSPKTCKGNLADFEVAIPYDASLVTGITWEANSPSISPTGVLPGSTTPIRTYTLNDQIYSVFKSPIKYSFSAVKTDSIFVKISGTFSNECGVGFLPVTLPVEVNEDTIAFNFSNQSCGDKKITFTNLSTPAYGSTFTKWTWDFGDASAVSNLQNPPQHDYPTLNPYTVKLQTVNTYGCASSKDSVIDFSAGVKAKFVTAPGNTFCTGGSITTDPASSSSAGAAGAITKWIWNMGEGGEYTLNAPTIQSHTYNNPGKFVVSLQIETANGCKSTLFIDTITVEATPVAKFAKTTACLGDSIILTDQSTISIGTIDTRIWTFGDGSPVLTDNTARAAHKYTAPGKYEVTLSVKSSGGCPSTVVYKDSVTVLALPVNLFDKDVDCTNKKVTFTDKSTTAAGTIVKRHWNFGDGTRDDNNVIAPTHSYSGTGPYTATLWVETSNGCQDSANKATVTFSIAASPVSSFSLPGNICLPNAVATFANTSTITDGTEAEFTNVWDFGDGSPTASSNGLASIQHTYTGAGPYTVKLVTTSKFGCTNTATPKIVSTIFTQPKANFTAPAEVCVNAKAALSSTGTAAGSAPDMWYWSFDGTDNYGTLSKKDTVAAWTTDGAQTIKHYFVSKVGCVSDTVSKSIAVNPLPVNLFDKDIDCSIKKVTFTDKSTTAVGTTIVKRHWVFGDGTRDDGNNATVTHTYSGNGPYTATLWVESSKGCQDSANRAVVTFTISATPASSFALPTANICLPAGIATFTNTSTITDGTEAGFVNSWDFGDGSKKDTSFGLASIQHSYTGVGPYTVKLTTTSVNGCTNTATPKILNTIYAQPKAGFTAPAEVCLNSKAAFASTGTAAASSAAEWYWDLGTGTFGTLSKKDTVAAWAVAGDKNIQHYIVSAAGCISDTATKTVTVNALPTASFTLASAAGCAGKSVSFTDASDAVVPGTTLTKWHYFFGDGKDTIVNNNAAVTHTYALGGSYSAKLVVTNSKGCISDTSSVVTVNVYANPVVGFTATPVCLPASAAATFTFTDTSSVAGGSVAGRTWDFADGTTPLPTDATLDHAYITGGSYKVILTATSDQNCVTVGAPTEVIAYNTPVAGDSIVNAANLCSSTPVTLINTSVVNGYGSVNKIEIFWDNQGDLSAKTVDNNPVSGGTYTHKYPELSADKNYEVVIRAYAASGCYNDSVRTIAVLASPSLTFLPIPGICEEKDTIQLVIPDDAYALAVDTIYFEGEGITTPGGRFLPALAGPGSHTITFTERAANGCASTVSQPIFVYATPTIKMDATKAVMEGDKVTLNPTITGNIDTYLWSPATYLNATDIKAPVSTPAADITYTLEVTTKDGCEADSSVFVNVLRDFGVPNTFTPNNDGINDNWIIEELPAFPIQKVQVFNRYGQVVYETNRYNPKGWDGTYKGKPLPFGTYYYIIELNGMVQPKVGYVTIIK